ncbi:hypothetical protein MJT46_006257 [Ovis ammon polii x Ovis aries]|nr:hypothetical protein MJT46_006257 [Ovis ammon polii x Ovis aries]
MLGQGPEYLTYFQGKEESDKSGMPKNRFSAERPESTYSYLKIQPVEPKDSAVYLCASSPTTVRRSHLLPVHKPLHAHFSSWFPEMPEKGATCSSFCSRGTTDANLGVTQTPRHEVTEKGQAVTLSCEPIKSHTALYWYRQTSVQGLQLLIYFRNEAPVDESGMPKDRFSAKMPNASFSTLKIQPTDPGDSAMYLCASSKDTALQSRPIPSRKPLLPLPVLPRAL